MCDLVLCRLINWKVISEVIQLQTKVYIRYYTIFLLDTSCLACGIDNCDRVVYHFLNEAFHLLFLLRLNCTLTMNQKRTSPCIHKNKTVHPQYNIIKSIYKQGENTPCHWNNPTNFLSHSGCYSTRRCEVRSFKLKTKSTNWFNLYSTY